MIDALRDLKSEKSSMAAIEDERSRSLFKTQKSIHKKVIALEDQVSTLNEKLDRQSKMIQHLLDHMGVEH